MEFPEVKNRTWVYHRDGSSDSFIGDLNSVYADLPHADLSDVWKIEVRQRDKCTECDHEARWLARGFFTWFHVWKPYCLGCIAQFKGDKNIQISPIENIDLYNQKLCGD